MANNGRGFCNDMCRRHAILVFFFSGYGGYNSKWGQERRNRRISVTIGHA